MSAETFFEEPRVLDTMVSFDEDRSTNELIIKREQHIDDDFIAACAQTKVDSANHKMGEMYHVASIPVAVVDDLLLTYGFDVMNAPVRETLAMLNRYALDKFILTTKSI